MAGLGLAEASQNRTFLLCSDRAFGLLAPRKFVSENRGTMSKSKISRRSMLKAVALTPVMQPAIVSRAMAADEAALNGVAGIDRVAVLPGKTYLRGWAGYGDPAPPVRAGPTPTVTWSKASGPGAVAFDNPKSPITTATFTAPGAHVIKLTVE